MTTWFRSRRCVVGGRGRLGRIFSIEKDSGNRVDLTFNDRGELFLAIFVTRLTSPSGAFSLISSVGNFNSSEVPLRQANLFGEGLPP